MSIANSFFDRVAGSDCHYWHFDGLAIAGAKTSKAHSQAYRMLQQHPLNPADFSQMYSGDWEELFTFSSNETLRS